MATIHEVAALAGVSPMTAARILAGKSQQSKSRQRVLKCAEKLAYVRNEHAANLRTGRSRLIGVMVPFIDNPFYTKFLQEMHDTLAESQYQSLIACSFGQGNSMLSAVQLFESYNVDGLVLDLSEGRMTPDVQQRLRTLQNRSRAVVVTGSQRHDLSYDHLYLDNHSAIEKVMRHLLSRGHRRFGFVGGWAENPNIANRLDAFKTCIRNAGLTVVPELISLGDPALGDVTQRMHRLLRLPERPTAIVCTSDMIAMIAVKAARETGLRVPQDLAVTGFDDIELANLLNPALTTVRQPLNSMAREIVNLVLHRLEAKAAPFEEKRFEADLVIREST
jgi:DNA-binding LacI/PurR family transcriptional regulator